MSSRKASSARPATPEIVEEAGSAATPRASRNNDPRTPTQTTVSSRLRDSPPSPTRAETSETRSLVWGLDAVTLHVADLLRIQLPPSPPPKNDDFNSLSKTKEMSYTEMSMPQEERMTAIVYAPLMLDKLITKVKKELAMLKIDFEIDIDFVVATSPWHTRGPYIGSCPGDKRSIADAALHEKGPSLKAVVEVKCPNVLGIIPSDAESEDGGYVLSRLLKIPTDTDGNLHPGLAIKFNWPTDEPPFPKGTKPPNLDTETRILVQIWTQLLKNKCDMGMLSAYLLSIFTHHVDDVMYMSAAYRSTEEILFATVAWMAVALELPGYERSELSLPEPDMKLWSHPQVELSELYGAIGVVEPTTPGFFDEQVPSTQRSTSQPAHGPNGRASLARERVNCDPTGASRMLPLFYGP
ncbi:hypothetical protein NM688_g248 [Phlebia brevispora]|uniref:Uncharacterized protein n=1 Tax=Phlebia brevispora TaxID=194682 RepID=A0ACC1TER2_9APHY|nr:hypothetical protein NM688_g248 [Phlebia brevispora]